jgi:uncharacterized protein (TIGR03066 family)
MRSLGIALTGLLLLAFASVGQGQGAKAKIDKAKLVGTWTFVKTDSKDAPPPGVTLKIEFTKDGKHYQSSSFKDKSFKASGTYSVEGDQLTTILKGPGGKETKETVTITELTDKKLVTTEKTKDGVVETTEFKR